MMARFVDIVLSLSWLTWLVIFGTMSLWVWKKLRETVNPV